MGKQTPSWENALPFFLFALLVAFRAHWNGLLESEEVLVEVSLLLVVRFYHSMA